MANADAAAPEQTILVSAHRWPPWDPAQINGVGELLDRINPYFETPLVEAMCDAADRAPTWSRPAA